MVSRSEPNGAGDKKAEDRNRDLWRAIRRALLMIVRAIEAAYPE